MALLPPAGLETALEVLGLPAHARRAEVGPAFRRLALAVHPDVNPSADARARFEALLDAHDVAMRGLPAGGPVQDSHPASQPPRAAVGDVLGPPAVLGRGGRCATPRAPIVAGPPVVERGR